MFDAIKSNDYDLTNPQVMAEFVPEGKTLWMDYKYFFGFRTTQDIDENTRKSYLEHEKIFRTALEMATVAERLENWKEYQGTYYGDILFSYRTLKFNTLVFVDKSYSTGAKLLSYLVEMNYTNLDCTMGELVRAAKYCDRGGRTAAAKGWIKLASDRISKILETEDKTILGGQKRA